MVLLVDLPCGRRLIHCVRGSGCQGESAMERPAQKSSRIAGLYFAVLALFPGALTFASRPTESSLIQQAPEVAERFEVIAIHQSGEKGDRPSLQFLPGGA